MEYKKVQYWYNTIKGAIKEIGKSLYFNFISGEPQPDGLVYKKNMEWGRRFPNKKISKETKKTIDDKI